MNLSTWGNNYAFRQFFRSCFQFTQMKKYCVCNGILWSKYSLPSDQKLMMLLPTARKSTKTFFQNSTSEQNSRTHCQTNQGLCLPPGLSTATGQDHQTNWFFLLQNAWHKLEGGTLRDPPSQNAPPPHTHCHSHTSICLVCTWSVGHYPKGAESSHILYLFIMQSLIVGHGILKNRAKFCNQTCSNPSYSHVLFFSLLCLLHEWKHFALSKAAFIYRKNLFFYTMIHYIYIETNQAV